MFVKDPERDFTKKRKLPFDKVVSFLLAMEGGTLTTELLKYFGCSPSVASNSAFVQQRGKVGVSAFSSLFDLFVQKTHKDQCYKGLHLLAADGSDLQIPTNSNDPDSYFPAKEGQSAYNLLHLDAMYDLLRHTYIFPQQVASMIQLFFTSCPFALCAFKLRMVYSRQLSPIWTNAASRLLN